MQYLAYHFIVDPPQPGSEILIALIADMGFESFDVNEKGFIAYLKEEQASDVSLNDLQFEDFKYQFTVEKIEAKNWNAEWEKNFDAVEIDDLLIIRAPFHETNKKFNQEIIIMPKMSFGTGHHQTTQLMCAGMFEIDLNKKRVLDMGCGTGVLAILSKKLGSGEVLAIDIDEWSVDNSIENCVTNNCEDILVMQGDVNLLELQNEFDVIFANINKNILKAHMKTYSKKLKNDGKLFLSGFFKTDVDELTSVAETQGLKLKSCNSKNEWAMMVLEKI